MKRNSTRTFQIAALAAVLGATLALASAHAAPAKRKAGLGKGSRLTPSQRAGIPPEAFGSPVPSPDKSRTVWIADVGDGANLFVGPPNRRQKTPLTHYQFKPSADLMPGLPILWSPDGKYVAYFEYSHSGARPFTSSHAMVVPADGSAPPASVPAAPGDLNTRPVKWLSPTLLRLKALTSPDLKAPEEAYIYDLTANSSMTETAYEAAQAAARAAADSANRAAQGAAPPSGKK